MGIGDKGPKKTIIIVAGDSRGLYEEVQTNINLTEKLYKKDPNTFVVAFTDKPFKHISKNYTPISEDDFLKYAEELIQEQKDGILGFYQYGHGGDGPKLLLGGGGLFKDELVKLFSQNIDKEKRPYTLIVLDGCYSGGFGSVFLESNFVPDFFLGSSLPFATSSSDFQYFLYANTRNADFNKDGVVTLREAAIRLMSEDYPFVVMFSNEGSPDISPTGEPAKKPYFSKTIEHIKDHKSLLKVVENLRFGEQVVVLIGGKEGVTQDKMKWFEEQAAGGDGYYKFLMVEDNEESREYFKITDGPKMFAMGPNLRRAGVELEWNKSIGGQIPKILANENPLIVMNDWKKKGLQVLADYQYSDIKKTLIKSSELNSKIDFETAKELTLSPDPKKQTEGLQMLRWLKDEYGETPEILHELAKKILAGEKSFEIEVACELINSLWRIDTEKSKKDSMELIFAALKRGHKDLVYKLQRTPLDRSLIFENEFFCEVVRMVAKDVSSPPPSNVEPEVRQEVASMLAEMGDLKYGLEGIFTWYVSDATVESVVKDATTWFLREDDIQAKHLLLSSISANRHHLNHDEAKALEPELKKIVENKALSQTSRDDAKKVLEVVANFEKEASWKLKKIDHLKLNVDLGLTVGVLSSTESLKRGGLYATLPIYLKKGLIMDVGRQDIISAGLVFEPGISNARMTANIGPMIEWRGKSEGTYHEEGMCSNGRCPDESDDFQLILSAGYAMHYVWGFMADPEMHFAEDNVWGIKESQDPANRNTNLGYANGLEASLSYLFGLRSRFAMGYTAKAFYIPRWNEYLFALQYSFLFK